MERIQLKAFRAPDEPALTAKFIKEHVRVLGDHGIPQVVAPDTAWAEDPDCYVIVALHPALGMVGGVRLQMDAGEGKLPMEKSIAPLDPKVHEELAALRQRGNGEVCGLWNASRFANKGLVTLLGMAVTALATEADARTLTCFIAHYTKRYAVRHGFSPMLPLGTRGEFAYPMAGITSIAMVNPDVVLLPYACLEHRKRICSLRLTPDQTRVECPAGVEIEVRYSLQVRPRVLSIPQSTDSGDQQVRLSA